MASLFEGRVEFKGRGVSSVMRACVRVKVLCDSVQ